MKEQKIMDLTGILRFGAPSKLDVSCVV